MGAATANEDRLRWRRDYAGPVLLGDGFRPLFLAAALWAALAVPLWLAVWTGALPWRGAADPAAWHVHEMIFGFVAAAIGGFLLTAVPNWTGRLPVRGAALAALTLLWVAGRLAMWFSADLGPLATAALDLSYLAVLAAAVGNEIVAGRNWRNAPVLAAVGTLLAANALFHAEAAGLVATGGAAARLAIAVVVLLICLIGGRIVPSFTHNWFARHDGPKIPGPMAGFDRLTLAATALALPAWIVGLDAAVSGGALVAAGGLNLARLGRWRGWRTGAEPLVAILHLGYLWLAIGLALLGIARLSGTVAETAALHVLTLGAMGTMILAVMTRASLGHGGRPLTAGAGTVAAYAFVTVAMLARLAYGLTAEAGLLWLAAAGWTAAFALFVLLYLPLLAGWRPPRPL